MNKECHIYRYIYKMVEGGGFIFAPKKKFKVTLMKKIFDSKIIPLFSTFQVLHGARVMMVLPELRQRCHKSQTG